MAMILVIVQQPNQIKININNEKRLDYDLCGFISKA